MVPLFQTLTIIITPTTALASFKTAANTYLQKNQKDDHNQEHKVLSWKQEQNNNPEKSK